MRQIVLKIIFILFFCAMITQGIAQDKSGLEKKSGDVAKEQKVTVKVRSRGDFPGIVTNINMSSKTISVKNRGIVVTFDMLNPILKGYKSVEQIKIGDRISVSYAGNSTRITKGIAMHDISQQEMHRPKYDTGKNSKGRPVRVKERTSSSLFKDVDNNNDGKITPVELSAIVPNINMEDFKKYDKNNDGYLNEQEYNAINKSITGAQKK